ncbi:MAG: hypothetical protein EOL91_03870 [Actinobacteria bacterium]|nr:hypothetical protein [Actinomycetota bacterium]
MPPVQRRLTISARMLRPRDLLDLTVTAQGAGLRREPDRPVLVVGPDGGRLVVGFAFQHLGEQAWPESAVSPEPSGVATHRAARPSRLAYDLPAGLELPWTVEGLLAVLPTLHLRVVPLATPAATTRQKLPMWVLTRPEVATAAAHGSVTLQRARSVRLLRGLTHGGIGTLPDQPLVPSPPVRPRRTRPRPPAEDETALEIPYRLVVSPAEGTTAHDLRPSAPAIDDDRVQLWRTELTAPTVRAVWARDMEPPDLAADEDVTLMSTDPIDRRTLVRQSAATHEGHTPVPFAVRRLFLSALGAWVDWRGEWDTGPYGETFTTWGYGEATLIGSYRHVADMGRDSYVRVVYPGFLFPFGHRADLVKVTERKVHEPTRTAYLRQRYFIVLRETVRGWQERDTPLSQVTLQPTVTPDLDPVGIDPNEIFVPHRGGLPFAWDLLGVDRAGESATLSAALVFVPDAAIVHKRDDGRSPDEIGQDITDAYAPHRVVDARGQLVSFASPAVHGDTRLEANTLTWAGHTDTDAFTSRPYLVRANAVVPALRHLAGQAPGVNLVFAEAFLAADPAATDGFGPANPSGLFLRLEGPPVSLDFSTGTDRAGGFVAPNQMVRALSRTLGAVGDAGTTPGTGLAAGRFDAATFLDGALPKLFGLFDLVDLLEALAGESLDLAPSFVTEALDAISAIATEVRRLRDAATGAQARLATDLANAVASGAHQGARDAIAAAQAELDGAVGPLLAKLDAVATTLATLAGNPAGVAGAQAAITDLAGALGGLRTALAHPRIPVAVRSALATPLEALDALLGAAEVLDAVADFAADLLTPADGVTARFEWRPEIGSWPSEANPVFHAKDSHGFALGVVVRAAAQGAPSVDVSAELRDFALVLLPGEPLMGLNFSRIGFRVGSGGKPEIDVVFDGMEFLGALGFIETLRRMIPFDGFADPPYVDVGLDGVTAGFDLELPSVSVGVFSLENLALGADARVPFLGDAVTVGFHFCSKDSPFRLTVMCIGGGGWVALRLSPMGMVELEMGLEATAALSIDLGVASGSVSIAVGVYLRMEGEAGSLTGYFRIRGEVDVLGLISASITLELSLTYDFPTGKMIGRASLVVEVEVLFFSASVEVTCERKLAGSKGDPVLKDIMPPDSSGHSAAWSTYCAAFAPGA